MWVWDGKSCKRWLLHGLTTGAAAIAVILALIFPLSIFDSM